MCIFKKYPVKPDTTKLTMIGVDYNKIVTELESIGIHIMCTQQPDHRLFNLNLANSKLLVPFYSYSGEGYVFNPEAPDCNDYAKLASAEAAFSHHAVLEVWGRTPYTSDNNPTGRHAWNLWRVGTGLYKMSEPNAGFLYAGELFDIGGHGYYPDSWRI